MLLAIIAALGPSTGARAINWEGHTDWMADSPMSQELEASVLTANPEAWRRCRACGPRTPVRVPCRDDRAAAPAPGGAGCGP